MTNQFADASKMVLSPAAQAVEDAYFNADGFRYRNSLAAVLRVAADQVCPSDAIEPRNYLPMAIENDRIRRELLAIAAELEAQQ